MVRKSNGSINWIKIGITISLISMLLVIAGFVWSGSKTDTMAKEAYKFTSENAALPLIVNANIKDIEENKREIREYRKSISDITRIQVRQEITTEKLNKVTEKLDEISKRIY